VDLCLVSLESFHVRCMYKLACLLVLVRSVCAARLANGRGIIEIRKA